MTPRQFNDIFLPLHKMLYGLALTILRDGNEAEDCVQEAYARLWSKRPSLSGVTNHKAYASVTVRNIALAMLERRDRTVSESQAAIPEQTTVSTPHQRAENRDDLRSVASLLSRLPENQRRVIMLTAAGGLSPSEIKLATGLSEENIRVMLSRGRKRLRELFLKHNSDNLPRQ